MNKDKPHILGIDLGGTKTSICLGHPDGTLIHRHRFPSDAALGPENWFNLFQRELINFCETHQFDLKTLSAAGLSSPGPYSVAKGQILTTPNMPGWNNVPLVENLVGMLGCPVYSNNDANACAQAEAYFGEHKGCRDLVYLTASTGMGGGIITNGVLVQGTADQGGEVGFMKLDPDGPITESGQQGTFEAYCGGKNLADFTRIAIEEECLETTILDHANGMPDLINVQCIVAAVREKDPYALQVWDQFLERLAQGIGTLIMVFNPDWVLLGTIGIHAGDLIFDELNKRLPRYAVATSLESCHIGPSTLGADIGDLSAIAVARSAMENS